MLEERRPQKLALDPIAQQHATTFKLSIWVSLWELKVLFTPLPVVASRDGLRPGEVRATGSGEVRATGRRFEAGATRLLPVASTRPPFFPQRRTTLPQPANGKNCGTKVRHGGFMLGKWKMLLS